ncbi:MAG: excalibur calcium-binding domain-containing protein [Gammaproteobacteria bacterium]|nr:excalibur calcium-binding domain-containing protein [Gammaproteobacteria bacterium]MBU2154900.1 excalibur calcium-binding domain-containing protein [Gammaproteobacteria bacterium]MBU2295603.1 excalibur calcium-binding domain-containing protein [Gammaproteobacteria bacterium]
MKKLIIYALIAFVGWNYYQKNIATTQADISSEPQAFQAPVTALQQPTNNFFCDGRQHCSQMRSRAEAEYFVRNCPNTKMDGDHDGVPCENDSRF